MNIMVRVSPEEEFEVAEEELRDLLPTLPITAQVQDPVDGTWKTGSAYFEAKDARDMMAQAQAAQLSDADKKVGGMGAAVKLIMVLVVIGGIVGAFMAYSSWKAKKLREAHLGFARPYEEARMSFNAFYDCVYPDGMKKILKGKVVSDWLLKKHPKTKPTADTGKDEVELSADVVRCLPKLKGYVDAAKAITDVPAPEEKTAGTVDYREAFTAVVPEAERLLKGWAALAADYKTLNDRRLFTDTVESIGKRWVEWGMTHKKGGADARKYMAFLACTYGDDKDFATLPDAQPLVDMVTDKCNEMDNEKFADDVRTRCGPELSKPPEGKPPPHIAHGLDAFAGENLTTFPYLDCFKKVDGHRTLLMEREIEDAFDKWVYNDTLIVNGYRTILGPPDAEGKWAD